ncbi:MAG: hypothetical protein Unbinned4388contig1000_32 [Prokaryotic dsDNA virus sp.]|nr:MAG: hypothetical protein Unbinned4388contig1000_32 [Prokaryotic dsDNA virus sp.]|tara:strand:- start:54546 stop:54983 length:438 start_codon:yes stop_codon:yes gene_type:complete
MSTDEERKATPIFTAFVKYFPRAIASVTRLSVKANEQHNNGEEVYWAKEKSPNHLDSLMRHLTDLAMGKEYDEDGVLSLQKIAWRGMAALEIYLEKEGKRNFLKETSPTFYDVPKPMSAEELEKYADSLDSKQNQALAQIDNNEY